MRAVDALVEPVRPVAVDLDDVAEAGRHSALQRLDDLTAIEAVRQDEMDADLAVGCTSGKVIDARIGCKRNCRKQIKYEKPQGVAFLPHFEVLCERRLGGSGFAQVLFGARGGGEDLGHEA